MKMIKKPVSPIRQYSRGVHSRAFSVLALAVMISISAVASSSLASGTKVYDSDIPGVATAGTIFMSRAWTRQSPPGASAGTAYLRIKNNGDKIDRLIGGIVDYAERIEIHQMSMDDGVATMRKLDGIEIGSGETLVFEPGSYHLMIIGMDDGPVAGDTIKMSLGFEDAGLVHILMPVAPIGARSPQ
jgi:copper(I)-binding protein